MRINKILLVTLLLISYLEAFSQKSINIERKTGKLKTETSSIAYTWQGNADTTLMFLHGWGINSSYWDNQMDYFSVHYEVVSIDLPGFGNSKSRRDELTIESYANDVTNVISKLNLSKVIIVGHSMSGEIALEAALKNNKSIIGIVGVDNFKMIDVQYTEEQMIQMNSFFDFLKNDFKNAVSTYADNFLFSATTESAIRIRVKNDFCNIIPEIGFSSLDNLIKYSVNETDKLSKLNYKLYLINSAIVPTNIKGLEKYCKSSFEVNDIETTCHYPMIEKPEVFNKVLVQIVRKM